MDLFTQAAAATLLAVILGLVLDKQEKDIAVLLVIAVCCMVMGIAMAYLRPVLEFLSTLETIGELSGDMTGILFKVSGISILMEISATVCSDAGKASLGKTLQILGAAVILWLSIPIFTAMIDLVQSILEGV